MKNFTKKNLTAIIAIILLTTSATITLQSPVKAEIIPGTTGGTPSAYEYATTVPADGAINFTFSPKAYLSISPNPVGIGQYVLVNLWTTEPPAAERQLQHFTVTFTKPDGTIDKIENLKSYEADGTCWFEYVVDQVGTWQAVFTFAGQYFPAGRYYNGVPNTVNNSGSVYQGMYYNPVTTPITNLTVQSEQVMSWYSPLPTDYWTRPISLNNREWNVIAGNYPWDAMHLNGGMNGAASYLGPYITASPTAHILWMRQDTFPAGIIGGETGIYGNTASGDTPSVIFEGRCYDTRTVRWYNGSMLSCAICYDLRTGEMYYMNPTAAPFYGMTPTWIEYNKGTGAEVTGAGEVNTYSATLKTQSGTQMYIINPTTGAFTSNITCMTAAGRHKDWAITFQTNNTAAGNCIINWTTRGTTTNFTSRIISNVTAANVTSLYSGGTDFDTGITIQQSRFTIGSVGGGRLTAYSLVTGKMLWNISTSDSAFNPGTNCADQGKYFCVYENRMIRGIDEFTGKVLWETEVDYPWGDFWGYSVASAYGMFYAIGYAGVYAFNWTTGAIVWHWYAPAPAYETPYSYNGTSVYPGTGTPVMVDGMMYLRASEHTPTAPYTRGWGTYCINATTGELKWMLDEPMSVGACADGYATFADNYNGYTYFIGKGQSATTVSAPLTAVTQGQSVVITGTVTDLSAAQPGAACVSEASMGAYMSYLHLQSQLQNMLHPGSCTGVPVSIDAIDANGNYIHIATVTSDIAGTYSCMWKPDNVGKYIVTATFAGSPAYGSSWAETAVGVVEAPATATPVPTATPISMPPFETYFAASTIAIIIAIAIVGLLVMRKMRKRTIPKD